MSVFDKDNYDMKIKLRSNNNEGASNDEQLTE